MNVHRFRHLVHAVLLSAGPCVALGCSGVAPTEMPEQAQCADLKTATRYTRLTLSPGVDGIAFGTHAPDSTAVPRPVLRLASLGTPCATATDRDDCARRVDALLNAATSEGWQVNVNPDCGNCGNFVTDLGVITSGNEVHLAKLADVLKAAAPVETRDEAAVFLVLQGRATDCNTNNVRREGDGWTFRNVSNSCSGESWEYFTKVTASTGAVSDAGRRQLSEADNGCTEGRRPGNLQPTGVAWLSSLTACFSEIAHMEAAAVLAFDELAGELAAIGAPAELLARIDRARADEVAHAAMTARLATRFGGAPSVPRVGAARPSAVRPVMKLALENAVEGCVREAYGALAAAHQAAHAKDERVRAAFTRIALDEAEHAELSFDLDAWLVAQLTPEERREVDAARDAAWRELAMACSVEPAPEVIAIAGLPCARDALMILAHLAGTMDLAA